MITYIHNDYFKTKCMHCGSETLIEFPDVVLGYYIPGMDNEGKNILKINCENCNTMILNILQYNDLKIHNLALAEVWKLSYEANCSVDPYWQSNPSVVYELYKPRVRITSLFSLPKNISNISHMCIYNNCIKQLGFAKTRDYVMNGIIKLFGTSEEIIGYLNELQIPSEQLKVVKKRYNI